MRKRIIGFGSVIFMIVTLLALVTLGPSTTQSGGNTAQSSEVNIQSFKGAAGVNLASGRGPQVIATYGPPVSGVITGYEVKHDVSPNLRDIPIPPETHAGTLREMGRPGTTEDSDKMQRPPRPQITDPVLQTSLGGNVPQSLALTISLNFAGVSNLDGVYPPDTTGDVGPHNYVQWVNLHFQIFNKSGVSLLGPAAGNTLWSGFGGSCQTFNDGDI
jgi:hypothetical protein